MAEIQSMALLCRRFPRPASNGIDFGEEQPKERRDRTLATGSSRLLLEINILCSWIMPVERGQVDFAQCEALGQSF